MSGPAFKKSPLFRCIAYTVLVAFAGMLPVSPSYAQVAIVMPPPGQMIHTTRHFEPPQMVGLKINLKDPFSFDFIMDQGENPMSGDVRKEEFNKIIKYFLVSLAMPNKDMWVNLSPYESNRIIPKVFGQTEMGRDLLAQDYILKQFTASLIYPESGLGKTFWNKVYSQAQSRFGTTNINVNTFNKVWIVADKADVYQKGDTAFLVDSHLKVMLEQDYMAIEKNKEQFGNAQALDDQNKDARTKMASEIVREIIIPAIDKEVNEGKSFAAVRQVYNAEIMATWFKKTLRQSLLGQVFADKSRVAGQRVSDPKAQEKIYRQYLRAYKKGVFNYIKDDITPDGQTIPRKYFSGGLQGVTRAMVTTITPAMVARDPTSAAIVANFAQTAGSRKSRFLVVFTALFASLAPAFAQTPVAPSTGEQAAQVETATPEAETPQTSKPKKSILQRAKEKAEAAKERAEGGAKAVANGAKAGVQATTEEVKTAAEKAEEAKHERAAKKGSTEIKITFGLTTLVINHATGSVTVIVNKPEGIDKMITPDHPVLDSKGHALDMPALPERIEKDVEEFEENPENIGKRFDEKEADTVYSVENGKFEGLQDTTKGKKPTDLFFFRTGMPLIPRSADKEIEEFEKRMVNEDKSKGKESKAMVHTQLAVISSHDDVGGINLSDEHQIINIKVDGSGMPLGARYQDKSMMNLNGLTSIIRRITPITPENVPALFDLLK